MQGLWGDENASQGESEQATLFTSGTFGVGAIGGSLQFLSLSLGRVKIACVEDEVARKAWSPRFVGQRKCFPGTVRRSNSFPSWHLSVGPIIGCFEFLSLALGRVQKKVVLRMKSVGKHAVARFCGQ